jgi:hypothetical protein
VTLILLARKDLIIGPLEVANIQRKKGKKEKKKKKRLM